MYDNENEKGCQTALLSSKPPYLWLREGFREEVYNLCSMAGTWLAFVFHLASIVFNIIFWLVVNFQTWDVSHTSPDFTLRLEIWKISGSIGSFIYGSGPVPSDDPLSGSPESHAAYLVWLVTFVAVWTQCSAERDVITVSNWLRGLQVRRCILWSLWEWNPYQWLKL